MAVISLKKYFSQWDGDNGGAHGACGETCLKMIDCYLTGREVSIKDIIKNGDNNPNITSIAGMQKAAAWLGFGADYYYEATQNDIQKWLSQGKLIVAVLEYGKFPSKYKQDQKYQSGHFVVITGITDDKKGIRFADPNFWGDLRWEGWRDNNKWASWADFKAAFYHNNGNISRNGAVLVSKIGKLPQQPDKCAEEKAALRKQIDNITTELVNMQTERDQYKGELAAARKEIKQKNTENNKLRDINVEQASEITNLKGDSSKQQKRIAYLEPELDKFKEYADDLEETIVDLRVGNQGLETIISERDGTIAVLNDEIDRLKKNVVKELSVGDAVKFLLIKLVEAIRKRVTQKSDIIKDNG